MEVRERILKVKEFVAKDGRIFSPVEFSEKEQKNLEDYLKKECESHNERCDVWYDFKNFKIDEEKLKKWNPENWEHFKWEFFRKYVTVEEHTGNYNYRFHKIREVDFIPINSSEKLVELIKNLTYGLIEIDRSHRAQNLTLNWNRMDTSGFNTKPMSFGSLGYVELIFGSGLLEINNFTKEVMRTLIWRNDYDAAKHLINLGFKPGEEEVLYILNEYTRFKEKSSNSKGGGEILRLGNEEQILIDNNEDKFHFRYYLHKKQKELIEFMLDNFDGDYNKVLVGIANRGVNGMQSDDWGSVDMLQIGAKKKGIKSAFVDTDIITILRHLVIFKHYHGDIEKKGDDYYIRDDNWQNESRSKIKKCDDGLYEDVLLHLWVKDRQFKTRVEKLTNFMLERSSINPRKIYFWALRMSERRINDDEDKLSGDIRKEVNKLRKELFAREDFMDCGGGTIKGNIISGQEVCGKTMHKEEFYDYYKGMIVFDSWFSIHKIVDAKRRKINVDKPMVEKGEEIRVDREYHYNDDEKAEYNYFFND